MTNALTNALTARTWYDDTAIEPPKSSDLPSTSGDFDVAVIGGGLAGLTVTLKLAKSGTRVVLLEASSVGSGASGRNGGFCASGWAASEGQLRRCIGPSPTGTMMQMAEDGISWMREVMERPAFAPCRLVDGVLTISLSGHAPPCPPKGERLVPKPELSTFLSATRYRFGSLSEHAFHFHPLNFMTLLAQECRASGAVILEETPLASWSREGAKFRLETTGKPTQITARKIIFATGGYGGAEAKRLARSLMAIRTYIGVSEPMPDILNRHINTPWAISDTRRAGNYYRRLHDGRLLWGMGITAFGTLRQTAIKAMVMRDIAAVYPEMAQDMRDAGKGMAYGWSGNMAYAPHFLPYVGEIAPDIYALTGFGGHGMNTAPAAAMALADHLSGQRPDALTPFKEIPMRQSFGPLGRLAAEGVYHARRALDFVAERTG